MIAVRGSAVADLVAGSARLVAAAHAHGMRVVPLVGPSSLLDEAEGLALSSGLSDGVASSLASSEGDRSIEGDWLAEELELELEGRPNGSSVDEDPEEVRFTDANAAVAPMNSVAAASGTTRVSFMR